MEIIETNVEGAAILRPKVFKDDRGFFMETYQKRGFRELGIDEEFVQDNHSGSVRGTIRGLHYQIQNPQGKLVRAVKGRIYDVGVDLRKNSATFGQHVGVELSDENKLQVWFPPGYAHGFCVLSDYAEIVYKATDYYAPKWERILLWNDPALMIDWPTADDMDIIISDKDARGSLFAEADIYLE